MTKSSTATAEDRARLDKAEAPSREAMRLHPFYRGKMETVPRCRIRDFDDFSIWYSPGVAAPCRAIADQRDRAFDLTNKWNTLAVVSDGTRVLGLGDIGPEAALPVMEGKALLFKYLGGVDAVPLTLDTRDPDRLIETVLMLQPAFGGINLEDIAQPKCFRILDELCEKAEIPVWHDDQQGTGTVILAGLLNALRVTGQTIGEAKIAFIGAGASNTTAARLIFAAGGDPGRCVMVDSRGILGADRADIEAVQSEFRSKWQFCRTTNGEGRRGGPSEALKGMDVVIACSTPGPGTLRAEWIRAMNPDPIVFVCANPVPEIWPWEAAEAGAAVVATGRSDFPNQVNNSLCFPGLFRGVLDVRAHSITDDLCLAAAESLAGSTGDRLSADFILPRMDDEGVFPRVAADVGMKAQELGLAGLACDRETLTAQATAIIRRSRGLTECMMRDGFIPQAPCVD